MPPGYMERKSIPLEVKDLDKEKRTAIIAHAVYDNVDYTNDISRKGMFNRSWNASKSDISFYLNHNDEQAPGKVVDVYEEGNAAFTKAWMGTHTLGNDVLTMMDEGVIKKASFGYMAKKTNTLTIENKKVRELKEVWHIETSVLTKMPANVKAGIVSVNKSFAQAPELKTLSQQEQNVLKAINSNDQSNLEQLIAIAGNLEPNSDLYMWVTYNISRRADMMGEVRSQLRYNSTEMKAMQDHLVTLKAFCQNTKASDDCIKAILEEVEETETFIKANNTAFTQPGLNGPLDQNASVWNGWFK